jgi:purine-nucleoside phosphorylase
MGQEIGEAYVTDRMKQILDNLHKYNREHMAKENFGLEEEVVYDVLVVAPSYSPYKVFVDTNDTITQVGARGYCSGYEVAKENLRIAWIVVGVGGCNMLDYLLICGELQFKKLIFVGAAGALREDFNIGDICTPSYSIAGTLANTYLKESIKDYIPFEKIYPKSEYIGSMIQMAKKSNYEIKKASVFCTDSIAMEYTHLEEIKSFGTDLIEMETSTFYAIAELMDIPAIALLVVSDNSATGVPLVGRNDKLQEMYDYSRKVVFGDMIYKIAEY